MPLLTKKTPSDESLRCMLFFDFFFGEGMKGFVVRRMFEFEFDIFNGRELSRCFSQDGRLNNMYHHNH